jgi:2-polyprenyl-3-methyl-5-hydroxy-6-metoxy-1,4-benzoquinol methylase
MANPTWDAHIGDELAFWQGVIAAEAARGRNRAMPQQIDLRSVVASLAARPPAPDEVVRILDVGSGPFSTLGIPVPDSRVEVVYADALAAQYNALLDRYRFDLVPRITPARGEELSQSFGHDAFHWVNCANALDHFADPHLAFVNMMAVCKPGGVVTLISIENEGQRENYQGLHQWNL